MSMDEQCLPEHVIASLSRAGWVSSGTSMCDLCRCSKTLSEKVYITAVPKGDITFSESLHILKKMALKRTDKVIHKESNCCHASSQITTNNYIRTSNQ